MDRDSLTIGVTNALAEIPRANKRISAFCAGHNVPAKLLNRFSLSLDEVLTNIITHGIGDKGDREIVVRIDIRDGYLSATASDDGKPFDPLAQPLPDVHAPIEERKVGGLGIHLLRQLMDTVEYRRAAGRNELTFGIRIAE
jgi:anti-sigma regulatory factor (Ser/Thr protein kinase)